MRSQDGSELQFKVMMKTPLVKLMQAYAARISLHCHDLKFVYGGLRLSGGGCPESYDMESGDMIDVLQDQVGD